MKGLIFKRGYSNYMQKFNFSEQYKEADKKYNLGKGEYFKVQEGMNKVRLVSICLPHQSEYKGQPTFKWLCQVIDRKDNVVKPYFMPVRIYKDIEALQLSDDFGFEGIPICITHMGPVHGIAVCSAFIAL